MTRFNGSLPNASNRPHVRCGTTRALSTLMIAACVVGTPLLTGSAANAQGSMNTASIDFAGNSRQIEKTLSRQPLVTAQNSGMAPVDGHLDFSNLPEAQRRLVRGANEEIAPATRRIPYKAFAIVDPNTGEPVSPDAEITLADGRTMKARTYWRAVNRLENQLNQRGQSLRMKPAGGHVDLAAAQRPLLEQQADQFTGDMTHLEEENRNGSARPDHSPEPLYSASSNKDNGAVGVKLGRYWDYYKFFGDGNLGMEFKTWAGFDGQAYADLANRGNSWVKASIGMFANTTLFNNKFSLLHAETTLDANYERLQLDSNVYIGGYNVFPISKTVNAPTYTLEGKKNWQLFNFEARARFWLGPVPLSAKVRTWGSVGYDYNFTLGLGYANASFRPTMGAYAGLEAGVDFWIFRGGAWGQLTLAELGLNANYEGGLVYNGNNLLIKDAANISWDTRFLAGSMGLYAAIDVWFWRQRWDITLFSWHGISHGGTLLAYSR